MKFLFSTSTETNDFLDAAEADMMLVIVKHVHHHPIIGGAQDGVKSIVSVCVDPVAAVISLRVGG